ncbi:enoyl-CoA hydratase [Dactylosporangium sucinum]|uniref:Enoyl-CoA hydratase n=1 Tax=Dactylosporangium sucinum TaxID=1424081 RepID=A0A917UFV2_9ACTN|nr:enoyl-CoA hydratase [Dactylosporangium sucinum]GGM89779.1 enoyl-CoA hydratase [Dactylosporangium sucinum]
MPETTPETGFERIRYDVPAEHVARITLARPELRNAQDYQMLHELDTAFQKATTDDEIKVIVLAADGPHFSSGHDLTNSASGADFEPHCMTGGYLQPGQAGGMANEEEFYLGMCWRWRNVPKPTIAQVQGKVIAGGLMLVWPMDIIIASEDASFSDPTVAFAVNGHEYHTHTWELGARKAKEMLFRSNALTAEECRQLGMVNHVVARADLEKFTLEMASEIARRPAFGLKLAKLSVNGALEAQGQFNALRHAFALHQAGHANARAVFNGIPVDPMGIDVIRQLSKS